MSGKIDTAQKRIKPATFVVHIQYNRNASWQGQVTWTETKETVNFRSALELIKLIDGAVEKHFESEKEES